MIVFIVLGVLSFGAGTFFLFFLRNRKSELPGFDNNPLPQWVFDKGSLRFLAVNKAAIRHYGFSEEEFQHMTIEDIRPAWDVYKLKDHINEQSMYSCKEGLWKHLTSNGDVILVKVTAKDILYQGKMQRLVTAEDVTHTLKANNCLQHLHN